MLRHSSQLTPCSPQLAHFKNDIYRTNGKSIAASTIVEGTPESNGRGSPTLLNGLPPPQSLRYPLPPSDRELLATRLTEPVPIVRQVNVDHLRTFTIRALVVAALSSLPRLLARNRITVSWLCCAGVRVHNRVYVDKLQWDMACERNNACTFAHEVAAELVRIMLCKGSNSRACSVLIMSCGRAWSQVSNRRSPLLFNHV